VPCIFCGSDPVTREHVYNRAWIERLAPHATSFTNERAVGYRRPVTVNTWVSSEADVVVKCVCADCNNGWMNALDANAEPMVSSLCLGEQRVVVKPAALTVFATWAVKMGLVMECLMSPMVVPQTVRSHLHRERTPPSGVRAWIATMETWEAETRTTPTTLESAPAAGAVEQAYLATFRMLHLVVQVLVPLDTRLHPEHDEWGALHSEPAWPRAEPLEWPLAPDRMLRSDEDYFRLTESLRSPVIRA
jgi:hypothetical protein